MASNSDAVAGGEYQAGDIKKTVWGQIRETRDGAWLTSWALGMDASRARDWNPVILVEPEVGFEAELQIVDTESATLQIKTTAPAMSAEYYPLTFSSFRIVNDEIGEIWTIEGLPRNWYAPFRTRG